MIVFRDHTRPYTPAQGLAEINRLAMRLVKFPLDQEAARDLLMRYGELETAWTDRLCRHRDEHGPRIALLRRLAVLTGGIFCDSWRQNALGVAQQASRFANELRLLSRQPLCAFDRTRIPEGYAYYGFYPEMYAEAAKELFAAIRPDRAVCVGIRSIGTSLSAAVCGQLRILGCEAEAFTVRPRGHPFERFLKIADSLRIQWHAQQSALFVVIDEGPGLSGSSFCSVAQSLADQGIPDDRIVFLPSWEPDPANLSSAFSRDRWRRYRKFVVSFDQVWIRSGRLAGILDCEKLLDVSAGGWRGLLYPGANGPPVQRSFERRKYLCLSGMEAEVPIQRLSILVQTKGTTARLAKFAGIGFYGKPLYERASQLGRSGFAPPCLEFQNGFVISEFMPGRPLETSSADGELMDTAIGYLDFLRRNFPAVQEHTRTETAEMILENTREGLGAVWAGRAGRLLADENPFERYNATAIDGRMSPHEWIRTPKGLIKTDGVEHHADHFFPGCQNVLWDFAGLCTEFSWSGAQRRQLVAKVKSVTSETVDRQHLLFYETAYLAYRLGYCKMASEMLGDDDDGRRFSETISRISTLLRSRILALENCRPKGKQKSKARPGRKRLIA